MKEARENDAIYSPRPRTFAVETSKQPANKNVPGPRCGHTLTSIWTGTGAKQDNYLVLFGGATALEGNDTNRTTSGLASSPSSSSAGIRLAGATNDVHIMDVRTGLWQKIEPVGDPPSPRAAHAAAAVGHMVVIQGGIGPAGLASEDLHVLDFTSPLSPRWHRVVVQGAGPGARYAHTLCLVAQHFMVAIGGNNGKQTMSDAWALDTSEKPYKWSKLKQEGDVPPARMYAATCTRQDGLLLLMGGRNAANVPLADAHGLVRHRDGRWEWTAAPGPSSSPRYQHGAVFVGGRMHVVGGALGGNRLVDPKDAVSLLDTTTGIWYAMEGNDIAASGDSLRRCRHAVASVGPLVFVYGGLRGGVLLDDMLVADDGSGNVLDVVDERSHPWELWLSQGTRGSTPAATLLEAAEAEAAVAMGLQQTKASPDLQCLDEDESDLEPAIHTMTPGARSSLGLPPKPSGTPARASSHGTPPSDVRLHHRAVVVAADSGAGGTLGGLVRQLSIDQFENEGRRVSGGSMELMGQGTPVIQRQTSMAGVHKKVLRELLKPSDWVPPSDRSFLLKPNEIVELCDSAEVILSEEPNVLQLQAPIKIFGDLHGQFGDLMRLFKEFGCPQTASDITYIDYLFLGDYVDRGLHSLETMCLLLALKIEYKSSVHLIRGNHEAADINALFGFRLECVERLGEAAGIWIWQKLNALFNHMPLAATIENKILCMHGGIGKSIHSVADIQTIQRPVTMESGGPILMDLLWSDPTTNDSVEGVQPSPRGPGLVTFGPDRVKAFCQANNLQMIIRAHECVMDGFERFAGGQLITLFSATNYCGTANNAGAILVVGRDLVLVPKLIHPVPPQTPPNQSPPYEEEQPGADTWMLAVNNDRPPTPPRGRPSKQPGSSLAYF